MILYLIRFRAWNAVTLIFLTFLHLANAIIVIKFPGTPTNMNTMHVADAKCNKPDGYPWNSSSYAGISEGLRVKKRKQLL